MTTTTELHAAIAQMQVLMTQAADVIEHNTNSLAESHSLNGIIKDTEVQASIESDTDLVAHLRAAALPWDQRHKSTERPQSRAHQFPADQVEAVRAELQEAVEAHGLTAKPEPTMKMLHTYGDTPQRECLCKDKCLHAGAIHQCKGLPSVLAQQAPACGMREGG